MLKVLIKMAIIILPFVSVAQTIGKPLSSTKIHYAYLDDCNDDPKDSCITKHFYLHIDLGTTLNYDANVISYIKLRPIWFRRTGSSGESTVILKDIYTIYPSYNGFEIEFYEECISQQILEFEIEVYNSDNKLLYTERQSIDITNEKEDKINVSEHMDALLGQWQKTNSSLIQFFCNKQISQIELLAFFRDYMDLTIDEMCEFLELYNLQTKLEHDQNVIYIWKKELCELFEEYIKGLVLDENEDDLCNCKMITTNRTALNGGTSSIIINDPEDQCYDYEPWVNATNYEYNNDDDDWIVSFGRLGAFKGVGFLADYDGGDDSPNEFLVERSGVSNISFRSVCSDPITITPNLENCQACVKEIELKYYYKTQGFVYGETSYHIDGAKLGMRLEDWAMVTVQNHDQITTPSVGGRSYTMNCEAPGQSITEVLTSVSSLIDPISTVLDTSQSTGTQIGAAIQAAGIVIGLIETNVVAQACQAVYDSDTLMLSGTSKYELLPGQFFQAIMTSGWAASGKAENNGQGRIILNSDGYMSAVVNTIPNEDGEVPEYCECEKMASYVLGSMEGFEPDDVNVFNRNPFTDPSTVFDYYPDGNFNLQRYVGDYIGSHGPWGDKWEQTGCCSSVEIECLSQCAYISGCENAISKRSSDQKKYTIGHPNSWKVSPNPSKQYFDLVNDDNSIRLDLLEISIFDIRGKRLLVSSQDQRYDVSHLDNGVYFIEILDKLNMKSSIIKLIKTE